MQAGAQEAAFPPCCILELLLQGPLRLWDRPGQISTSIHSTIGLLALPHLLFAVHQGHYSRLRLYHMQWGAPQSLSVLCHSSHAAGRGFRWLATQCHLKLSPCQCPSSSHSGAQCSFPRKSESSLAMKNPAQAHIPLHGSQWLWYGAAAPPEAGFLHALLKQQSKMDPSCCEPSILLHAVSTGWQRGM